MQMSYACSHGTEQNPTFLWSFILYVYSCSYQKIQLNKQSDSIRAKSFI